MAELTLQERGESLLAYLTHQYRCNGPITEWAVKELAAVVQPLLAENPAINGG